MLDDRLDRIRADWELALTESREAEELAEGILAEVDAWERKEDEKLPIHRIEALCVEAWHRMLQKDFAASTRLYDRAQTLLDTAPELAKTHCARLRSLLVCRRARLECYLLDQDEASNYSKPRLLLSQARDCASEPDTWAFYLYTRGIVEYFADDFAAAITFFRDAIPAAAKARTSLAKRTTLAASLNLAAAMARVPEIAPAELLRFYREVEAGRYSEPVSPNLVPEWSGVPNARLQPKQTPEDAAARLVLGLLAARLTEENPRFKPRGIELLRGAADDFEAMGLPMYAASALLDLAHLFLFAPTRRTPWAKARQALERAVRLTAHQDTRAEAYRLLLTLTSERNDRELRTQYRELRPAL